MNILFVCTGNTCRSPMAEHLFRKMLKDAGKPNVTVASAGTHAAPWVNFPPEAQEALASRGVTPVRHTAQDLTGLLIQQADLILTMEEHHRRIVNDRFPEAREKTYVLKSYVQSSDPEKDIRDPIGFPVAVYNDVLSDIERALIPLLKKI